MNRREYDLELAALVSGLTQAEDAANAIIALLEATELRSTDELPVFIRDMFVNVGFSEAVEAANDTLDYISQAFDRTRDMDEEVDNALGTEESYDSTVRDSVDNWPNDRRWLSESAQDSDEVRRMDSFVADYKR